MKKLLIKMVSSFKIVLLLMLFVVVYYYTIAADRYVSEISWGFNLQIQVQVKQML